MMKTFNCGVGFCLIASKKNIKKLKKFFKKNTSHIEIGFISVKTKKVNLNNSLVW